jgi:hypothetical protein
MCLITIPEKEERQNRGSSLKDKGCKFSRMNGSYQSQKYPTQKRVME